MCLGHYELKKKLPRYGGHAYKPSIREFEKILYPKVPGPVEYEASQLNQHIFYGCISASFPVAVSGIGSETTVIISLVLRGTFVDMQ